MGRRESGGKAETEAQRRCCGTLILGEDQGSLLGGVRIRVVCFLGLFSDQGKDMGIFWFLDMGRVTALLR